MLMASITASLTAGSAPPRSPRVHAEAIAAAADLALPSRRRV
jgi:hypothetical protein